MKIETIVVGALEENCYILSKEGEALIVDPGAEAEKIIKKVGNKNVLGILITHRHFDHIGALKQLKEHYQVEVYEKNVLEEGHYKIGPFSFDLIFTPGHSEDSVTFYFKEEHCMLIGDFIFYRSIGRTDLETGNMGQMQKSIVMLKSYPDETILYPGHGLKTTIQEEKQYNLFFQ